MGSFLSAQILSFLILASPGPDAFRLALGLLWLWTFVRAPLWVAAGTIWQVHSLIPLETWHWSFLYESNPANLRCDPRFWFLCSSPRASLIVGYLSQSALGQAAEQLRTFVQDYCFAWHPLWGNLAMSLLMGGKPDERLKVLYKNLGFLHVLVISGSQFTLLASWMSLALRTPVIALYASTLIDWRQFRPLSLMVDLLNLLLLLIYLLACGASPPCQRAFLEQSHKVFRRWLAKPESLQKIRGTALWVFTAQALLFPTEWFSLSTLLSWGAVYSLKFFAKARSFSAQLRVSLSIQLLSLAIFARLSIASLLLDFFVAPIWDLLLFVCLLGIFAPALELQNGMTIVLDFFHEILWQIDRWQIEIFGSSALSLRPEFASWGRLLAGLVLVSIFLNYVQPSSRPER
jgi:predicted membrane metal-binding protein